MDDEVETLAVAQEVVFATVAVGHGGSGYLLNDTVTPGNGVVLKATTMTGDAIASVTIVNHGSTSAAPPANPVPQVSSSGVGIGAQFNLTWAPIATVDIFPGFTPIIPTSVFPPGGGVGSIGDPIGVPTFPPPTPPPIGTVPKGPLVGPEIVAAAVPPSTAGFPLLRYQSPGSATVPPVNGYFPKFTTTTAYAGFPNQPPAGVPIVFANISTNPSKAGAVWTVVPPPSTATVAQIILDGWGLPGPSGSGPGPPSSPNPPGAGLPYAFAVRDGHEEPAERPAGTVFPGDDVAHLHQSRAAADSRGKRLSARHSAGRANRA